VILLGQLFYWALNLSILGSLVGLIVLLLRRLKPLPKFGVYLLWALPLIRLWLPIGVGSKYSVLGLIPRYITRTVIVWQETPAFSMTNSIQAAGQYFPIVYKTDTLGRIFEIGGAVWAIVTLAAVLCTASLYFITKSAVKDAKHVRDNIYQSNKVLTPAVYGMFRPKIILPPNISDDDLAYILLHEQTHIRRRDNLWRIVAVLTACLHWFNPLVWLFLRCFLADMELACDAGVLKKLGQNEKKPYAAALLNNAAGRTYYASAFGGSKTRLRIERILSYKKLTLFSGICFVAFFIVITVTVITNAVGG
jgi:beta-lactamase regulating signal transducer with metallopeptidase domain